MVYYTVLVIMIISCIFIYCFNKRIENITYIIFLFILFFIAAFRYETGNDWRSYEGILENSLNIEVAFNNFKYYMNNLSYIEIGYRVLNSLIKTLGGSIQSIFFLSNLFFFYALNKFIKENCKYKMLSLLVYYSVFFLSINMSIVRQGIAISFFLISFQYLKNRNVYKYMICTLLAILFHTSALILIPIYFIYNFRYCKKIYIILIISGIIIRIADIRVISKLITYIPILMEKGEIYIDPNNYVPLLSFGNIERIIMAILIITLGTKIINKKKDIYIFISLYIIYIFLNFAFYESITILSRIRYYLQISYIVILPLFIDSVKKNTSKLIMLGYIICFSIIPICTFLSSDINNTLYNPYQNLIIHKYIFNIESDGINRFENIHNSIKGFQE